MAEFCEKDGTLLMPQKAGAGVVLICRNGHKYRRSVRREDFKLATTAKQEQRVVVVEKKEQLEVLPKTQTQCPKCEHTHNVYWWMQQTRSADEPPTRFFKCPHCGHVWREYE